MDQVSRALLMAGGAAEATDSQFSGVTMLLKGDGTNGAQNNTFVDASTNNFTITRNGNTTQGTFTPYGANWSNYFDGTGDNLSAPSNAAFTFGTGDFTVEMWVYPSSDANMALVDARSSGTAVPWAVYTTATTRTPYFYDGTSRTSSIALTLNAWNHVAVARSSSTLKIFVNGAEGYSASNTTDINSTGSVQIGGAFSGSYYTGYISNLRILKGTALYTAAFTPPTAPLTAITNTSLLTCQSNRFIDNSANAFTITRNGDTSVQRFSPFSPTAAYSTGNVGGSGYFDGSGDYLDVANNNTFDTNSTYTLDCWFYQPTAQNGMLFNRGGGAGDWNTSNGYQFTLMILSGNILYDWNNSGSASSAISATAPAAGAWHHVAVGYNGTTTRVWVDGASIGTSTISYTMPTTRNIIRAGADQSTPSASPLRAYMSGLRFVKGTDVYGVGNTTITVPTSPFTAITNTSLLLNYTNAGIIDNAMMNNLETVGNAQISTTQSKWGGSSLAFDGTGDGLYRPYSGLLTFRTGNFTVEFWMYFNSKTGYQTIASLGYTSGSSNRWLIQTGNGDGKLIWYSSSPVATDTGSTVDTGQWYHIAIVKNGSTTTIYRDGVSVGSGTDNNDYDPASNEKFYVGGGSSTGFDNYYFNGYIDDLRITKGYARYTANFTPPDSLPTR